MMAATTHETDYLLAHYQTKTLPAIAADLGLKVFCVRERFARLVRLGLADPLLRCYHRPWTWAEEQWLLTHLGKDGWGLEEAAKRLKRTVPGIRCHLRRKMGIRRPLSRATDGALRLGDLIEVMGLCGNHHAARRWITEGFLKAERIPEQGSGFASYAIYHADLVEFLTSHPGQYDWRRMPERWRGKPNPFRAMAPKLGSPTAGYLTVKQAARLAGIRADTMRAAVSSGRIPARHLESPGIHPQEWFITRTDLETYMRRRARPTLSARIRAEIEDRGIDIWRAVSGALKEEIAAAVGSPCSRGLVVSVLTGMRREVGAVIPVGSWRPPRERRPEGPWQVRWLIDIACYQVRHRQTGAIALLFARVDDGRAKAFAECDRLNARPERRAA